MTQPNSQRSERAPIAGLGSEVWGWTQGWCHCGSCGYTGRVKGPRQAACGCWIWHGWLEHCAQMETI